MKFLKPLSRRVAAMTRSPIQGFVKVLKQTALIFILVAILNQSLNAMDYEWNVTSGNWAVPANWAPNLPPGPPPTNGDTALIINGGTATVQDTEPATGAIDVIDIGDDSGHSTVNVTSGGNLVSTLSVVGTNFGTGLGNANIIGPNAKWTSSNFQVASALASPGVLNISNGGVLETTTSTIGGGGQGNVTVTGTNSAYSNSGAVIIGFDGAQGVLQVLSGGTFTDASAILANDVGSSAIVTVDGVGSMLDNGTLTIGNQGSATVTIQNSGQAVSTSTTLASLAGSVGILNLNSLGLFNTGSIAGGAGNSLLTFNGGILQASANNATFVTGLSNPVSIQSGGAIIDTQAFNIGINQTLTGPGALTKLGSGVLTLMGTNSYAGGTTISAGTLQGDTNSIPSGSVLDNGTLIFNQTFNGTFAGSISGGGSLVKEESGLVALTEINSYTGGTVISAGTLQGDTNSIPSGSVLDNGTLIFNQTFNGTFAGSISGGGSFLKEGTAQLQLTGNSGSFSGNSTVVSGILNVNGILGGALTVNSGATLSGTGFLGNVTNNGTIAPGNSIGTIHVNNFINNSTGIYQAEINSSGASDEIVASGTATLNGGELVVTADPGIYMTGTTYTLIDAAGGLAGQFATTLLPTNVPLSVSYLPNQLILTVLANVFNTTGLSGNALRVAEYIRDHATATPDFSTVVAALNTLDPAQLQKALNQLHPALFEALTLTASDTAHMINTSFMNRLDFLRNTCCRNVCCNDVCNPCNCNGGVWVGGVADFIRQDRTEELRRFTTTSEGVAFGIDNKIGDSLFAGVGGAYSHTNLHWGNSAGRAKINSYYIGAYATTCNDCYYIDASVLGFIDRNRIRRHIHFVDIDRRAKNKHYSYGVNPHLGGGLYLNYCSIDIIPFVDLDYYFVEQNKAREHGAKSLDLRVKRNRANILRLETGIRFSKCYDICYGRLLPNISISYVAHRLLSGKKFVSALNGIDATFAVFGTRHCFNQLELGGGLRYIINDQLAINTWYDVELGHKRQEQEVNIEINYRF